MRRVVVVGGSIAATTAVESLRLEGFDGTITMLSDEDVTPYTRVPLSKGLLAGRETEADVLLPPMSDGVDLRLRARAVGIDEARQVVRTVAGDVPYDGLVIATGSSARRLTAAGTHPQVLRDLPDARTLESLLPQASSVLVIGGGFLGMEIASTCRELGKDVTVIDREPPLERLLGPLVAARMRRAAEAAGVRLRVVDESFAVVGTDRAEGVRLSSGETLTADLVVSAIGDQPNVEWLAHTRLASPAGVHVDSRCRAARNIVAAGDVAVQRDGRLRRRNPSWTNAVEQARAAASALLRGDGATPYRPSRYYWTEQFGIDLKMVGVATADDPTSVEGSLESTPALMEWSADGDVHRVVALNHPARPAQLKRRVTRRIPTAQERTPA